MKIKGTKSIYMANVAGHDSHSHNITRPSTTGEPGNEIPKSLQVNFGVDFKCISNI